MKSALPILPVACDLEVGLVINLLFLFCTVHLHDPDKVDHPPAATIGEVRVRFLDLASDSFR